MSEVIEIVESSDPVNKTTESNGEHGQTNSLVRSEAIEKLLNRTGYPLLQENGQRRYGPPTDWKGDIPGRGCEVFVGKIPRDCYEDELIPVLEKAGQLYECRIMVDFEKGNRGFCFATYSNKEEAKKAVKHLNNYEIRDRRYIGICLSVDNCRLFVGGIPLDKKEADVTKEMAHVSEGVVKSIVYPSIADKSKNRGFAFVEYENHKAAAVARRKLMPGKILLWGQQVAVDWAEPEVEVDEEIMSKVKILYVRNLMTSTTEETILKAFQEVTGSPDAIEKVKKLKDFAFVHFKEREEAIKAMNQLNDTVLDGSNIVVVLAKPPNKDSHSNKTPKVVLTGPNFYPQLPFIPPAFCPFPTQMGRPTMNKVNGTAFKSDVIVQNFPTIKNKNNPGARKAGGMSRSYGGNCKNGQLFDLRPGTELVPLNPHTLKPIHVSKSPVQALEELCQRNGWEMPVYHLHSAVIHGDQLFTYKVFIPNVSPASFVPPKLCRSVDDAKKIAAEFVLFNLGVSVAGNPAFQMGEYCF